MTLRSLIPHLAALVVVILCVRLAFWQIDRAGEKEDLIRQWETAPAIDLADNDDPESFAAVTATGRFDPDRHVLLDNQTRHNHPGVHVFTPFYPEDSDRIFMVNRGWQPWNRRDGDLPRFQTPTRAVAISARSSGPPRVGLQLGEAEPLTPDQWPNLMTYYDTDRIREVLGEGLADGVLLLDPDHAAHLSGDDWELINMGPESHIGYAFQWFSIGTAVFLIWLVLTIRSFRKS